MLSTPMSILYALIFAISISFSGHTVAKKVVTLATAELEPYIGEHLPNKGFVHELTTLAFTRAGYQVNIDFYPLARSRYLLELGRVDGMMPSYYEAPLLNDVIYSEPFYGGNIGLMKKKSLTLPESLDGNDSLDVLFDGIKDYSVSVVRGASVSPAFDQAEHLAKQLMPKDITNLDLLYRGRVDLIAIDKYTAADLMVNHRPHFIGQLEFISPFINQNKFHIAFSKKVKNHLQLAADFNQSLATMKRDGTLTKILNKHGLFVPKRIEENKIELTIGTVSNKDMLLMQKLSTEFERLHPQIKLIWKVLDENTLRKRLLSDIAISDGKFDIMTIGLYEALIWAKKGWLSPLVDLPKAYDEQDIFTVIRQKLSFNNKLYALPFYSESSITYFRKDLFKAAGINMPVNPTYEEIKRYAALLHKPTENIYGICLRGKPGWGENIALFTTMVNTHQGKWFEYDWQPALNSLAWQQALILYKDLLTNYGPPNPTLNGYNENKQLFADGHCAIWVDATVAAGELFDADKSQVAKHVALANAPVVKTDIGSKWLWTWALAISESSKNKQAAKEFITWATSKDYIETVAKKYGWLAIPPGTRKSTYQHKNYQQVAPFADLVLKTLEGVNFITDKQNKKKYRGIQFVEIPEFPALGHQVGHNIADVIEGKLTVQEALLKSQKLVDEQMRKSNYY